MNTPHPNAQNAEYGQRVASRRLRQKPFGALAARPREPKREAEGAEFREVMQRIGAVPLAPAPARVRPSKPTQRTDLRAGTAPAFHVEDQDGFVEGHRLPRVPRDVARLRGAPKATLDLHGYDVESARHALGEFLAGARRRGLDRVLLIVGKGHRTPGGVGILRGEIAGWLSGRSLGPHVLAFASAPAHLGGTGGVLVLLSPAGTASGAKPPTGAGRGAKPRA